MILIMFWFLFQEWYWRVWICPWLLRITAVLLFLLSVTLVWSEVTFFNVKPMLSIFAQMIHGASVGYYYFYVEVSAEKIILFAVPCVVLLPIDKFF